MPQTATNPETGEQVVLIGDRWVPITKTATNPETGERVGLADGQWIPIAPAKAAAPVPVVAPAPVAAPAGPPEEESYFSAMGTALKRGVPTIKAGFSNLIEDAPAFLANTLGAIPGTSPATQRLLSGLGNIVAKSEPYRDLTQDEVQRLQKSAEAEQAALGPGKYGSVFEEEGIGRKLGSVSESLAESAIPIVAGLGTGLLTRSPLAAGAVMGAGTIPMTYGGIRERQKAKGVEDIQAATYGTLASAGLDMLTGVGGKVLTVAGGRAAAKELLEGGLKQAALRIAKGAGEEGATETIQNVIEQVAGGADPTTKQAVLETLEAGLVGAFGGTVFTGATEAGGAVTRKLVGGTPEGTPDATTDPAVRTEFAKLASQEVAAITAANPDISQQDAVNIVAERSEDLLAIARDNVAVAAATEGGARAADTGLDDVGGAGAGAAATLGPTSPTGGTTELGETDGRRLGESVSGAPVSDVGAAAGESALSAAAFDPVTLPIYEAPTIAARRAAAKPIINDIIDTNYGDITVPAKVTNQIATQMAQRAARQEVFNPVDIVHSVLVEKGVVPETVAPEGVPPSVIPPIETVTPQAKFNEEVAAAPEAAAPETVSPSTITQSEAAPEAVAPPPEIFSDNPGGEWEARKQMRAEEGRDEAVANGETVGSAARMVSGPATQTIRRVEIPVEKLRTLEGVLGEQPGPGEPKYDRLRQSVDENGFDRDKAGLPMVFVNHEGEAYIYEGNNRVAVAAEEGVKSLPVEVQYINGAENAPGPFAPSELLAEHAALTEGAAAPEAAAPEAAAPAAQEAPAAPPLPPPPPPPSGAAPSGPSGPKRPRKPKAKLTTASVNAAVSAKLTKAQIKQLEQSAGIRQMELSALQKRIVQSRNDKETMGLIKQLVRKARTRDGDVGLLASLMPSLPPPVYKFLLGFQQIDDVFRLAKVAKMNALGRVDTLMREGYIPYVNRIIRRVSNITEEWTAFAAKSPESNNTLDDAIMISNMYDADPSMAPTAAEYMKLDPKLQELTAALAGTADPKKQRTLKGQITTRKKEIQRVYFGATDPDGTKVRGYNALPPEGKKIFRAARDFYRDSFKEHYRLLMQRIDDSGYEAEDAASLKAAVDKMFAKAGERTIYFPVKRFGEYWVSVGKDFYMRESLAEAEAVRDRLKDEGETREISIGYSRQSLRNTVANKDASAALKAILDKLDDGNTPNAQGKAKLDDVEDIKDLIFQMYLTALPEADMRRRFIHRQFKTGFSTDALRTFASTGVASANQLGRLAYGYKFNNEIDASKKETEGRASKPRLDTLTLEVEDRVKDILSPPQSGFMDWLYSMGAKATFLFYLSGPSSAFINLTQLHVVGLPVLSGEFGEAKTAAMAARYSASFLTGRELPNPLRDENGDIQMQAPNFDFKNSAYMRSLKESDPARYKETLDAWQYAQEHDIIESTFSAGANVYERSNTPTGEFNFRQAVRRGEVGTAARRATANTINAMGVMFHTTEKIGRSVMYMSSFDLAYERAIKQGKTVEEAGKIARELAAQLTQKAMFDFSNWNKPRFAKRGIGKLALQMTSYRQSMVSLLVRSFAGMLPYFNKEGKAAAARVFFGTAGVTALYGGLRATHIYMLVMAAYGLMEWVKSLGDDEDDEEREIEQGYLNPETIDRELMKFADEKGNELTKKDMEYYIRSVWIPETFGAGGTLQNALNISPENADKLAKAADMGLPALAGIDISNSVSLGDLWHPVDVKSDSPEAKFFEGLARYGLGPSAGLASSAIKAVDAWNNGDTEGAFEAALPAIIRNHVKAERLQEEGLKIGKNKDIVLRDPTFYDTYKTVMQSAGFREAETSRAMQLDIKAGDIEKEIEGEKTKLLDQRYRAILDYSGNPTPEVAKELRKIERDIDVYNLNYPSNAITADTKEKSFKSKAREAAEKAYGLGYNPKIPVRLPLAQERAAELGQ